RSREWCNAVARDAFLRRLEPDDAAECRRDADQPNRNVAHTKVTPPEPTRRTRDVGAAATSGDPYVSLIGCSTPSGHGNGLRLWIRTNGRRTAMNPVSLTLDFEHAHVSSHSGETGDSIELPLSPHPRQHRIEPVFRARSPVSRGRSRLPCRRN